MRARSVGTLGGWQRLGVVASVIWFFAGGLWLNSLVISAATAPAIAMLSICTSHPNYDYNKCSSAFTTEYNEAIDNHWWVAFGLTVASIATAWLSIWITLALVRWVRAGFRVSAS